MKKKVRVGISQKKELKRIIALGTDMERDDVINFITGVGFANAPSCKLVDELLKYISSELADENADVIEVSNPSKITQDEYGALILTIKNTNFNIKNLTTLWQLARDVKRKKLIMKALIAIGLVLVAGGVWFWLSNKNNNRVDETDNVVTTDVNVDVTTIDNDLDDDLSCDSDEVPSLSLDDDEF